jgi:ribonucleoside-diphosphate reductase alpha chain
MSTLGGDLYREIIHKTRYARFLEDKGRRETWEETVDRTVAALFAEVHISFSSIRDIVRQAILDCEVMPSMRIMMTAGLALAKENLCAYNCAYLPIDSINTFAEVLYILMCGTGVGFSCERKHISKLPIVPSTLRCVSMDP